LDAAGGHGGVLSVDCGSLKQCSLFGDPGMGENTHPQGSLTRG
jgi:hypothetical protein